MFCNGTSVYVVCENLLNIVCGAEVITTSRKIYFNQEKFWKVGCIFLNLIYKSHEIGRFQGAFLQVSRN
jgi:hypothetical protein